ncbi:MAG: hypothetical protein K5694_01665 [Bacilli bacterium]|nr:hypothetical protein [Bacilli bacterium]
MKKKNVAVLVLAASMLTGMVVAPFAVKAASAKDEGSSKVIKVDDIVQNELTPTAGTVQFEELPEGVELEVVTEGELVAGTIVEISVSIDETSEVVSVDALEVNGLAAGLNEEGNFFFEMPSEGAVVSAECTFRKYEIACGTEGVYFEGLPTAAAKGEMISAAYGFLAGSPSSAYSLEVVTASGEIVNAVVTRDTVSFVMPGENISIRVSTEVKYYVFNKDADTKEVFKKVVIREETVDEEGLSTFTETEVSDKTAIKAGTPLRAYLGDTNSYIAQGVEIVETGEVYGVVVDEKGNKYVDFPMANCDFTLAGHCDIMKYPFSITAGAHTGLVPYRQVMDEEGNLSYQEITSAEDYYGTYSEYIYFKPVETAQYGVKSVKAYYKYASGSESYSNVTKDSRGFFYFNVSNYQDIEIRIEEEVEAIPVTITDSEHLSGTAYKMVGGQLQAIGENLGLFPGDYFYLGIANSDPDNYALKYAKAIMTEGGTAEALALTADGYGYKYVSTSATKFEVTITEGTSYAAYPFVGHFATANVSASNSYYMGTYFGNPWISEAGLFYSYESTSGSYAYEITAVDEENKVIELIKADGSSTAKIAYTDNAILFGGSSVYSLPAELPDADNAPTVTYGQKVEADVNVDNLHYEKEGTTIGGEYYNYIRIRHDNGEGYDDLGGYFYDGNAKAYYFGDVTFNLSVGTALDEDGAIFSVSSGNEVLKTFGRVGNNLKLLDGLQGTYTNGDETIVVDGIGSLTVGDVSYDYAVIDAENKKIKVDGEKIVTGDYAKKDVTIYTLDTTAMTFTKEVETSYFGPVTEGGYDVELDSEKKGTASYSTHYSWTYDEESKTYTSGNVGKNSSYSALAFVATVEGTISFHVHASGEGSYSLWDYAQVFVNGVLRSDLGSSGKLGTPSGVDVDVEADLAAGDYVSIVYQKDSSSAGGDDCAVVTNVSFSGPITKEEYEHGVLDGSFTSIVLDKEDLK